MRHIALLLPVRPLTNYRPLNRHRSLNRYRPLIRYTFSSMQLRHSIVTFAALLALASGSAWAQDKPRPDGTSKPTAEKPSAKKPARKRKKLPAIPTDLAAAQLQAAKEKKPLVVIAGPGWFKHPAVAQLSDVLLQQELVRDQLQDFVLVRVTEGEEREVHVRHRLQNRGYPLTVVLGPDGAFLGSLHGLRQRTWAKQVMAVPGRHAKMKVLRKELAAEPGKPATLLALAKLHLQADEPDRGDALLARLEQADRADRSGTLAEARYLRLRIENTKALVARRFADVESICRKWLRRFKTAPQRPNVLLLQANARYLNGQSEEAKTLWNELIEKHAKTPAGRKAKRALAGL